MTPLSTKLKELRTVAENFDRNLYSNHNVAYTTHLAPPTVLKLLTALEECVAELDMAADYFIALKKTNLCIGVDERHVDGNCAYCEYDHAASQFSRSLSRINSLFQESGDGGAG